MIKQCFSWWSYKDRGVDDLALLKATKEIGFAGVEMIDENLWSVVHHLGLEIVSMNGHASIDQGLNDPANHLRIINELKHNLDKATKHSVRSLIAFSGNRRDGLSDSDGIKHTIDGLNLIVPFAQDAGVDINLELLNSKVDHPGYQCDHTDWAAQVVREVGSPRVKILYDIYHMQIMEGDLIRTVLANCELIGHYHTAGNPGRRDNDDEQEINYTPIYRAIKSTSYGGYIGHEFIPKGEPVAALKSAFSQCYAALA